MKTIYITESQKNRLNDLLLENEGTNMKRARKYLESKGYSSEQRQQILDTIRTDIPNSRLQQCKFLLGVTRLYMEGQLNDGNAIANLNKTLKYIASDAHVNEYDFNLNGENLDTLVQRFAGVAKSDLEQSKAASNARQLTVNNNYTIVPIDTPEEAAKYGKYTSWCVTHNENMYNSYTNNGSGRFYFCLHKGFENEPKVEGKGCPLDSYGLSMIAVSVTMEGEVNTITCRWNHDNGGNDNVMTIEQLEDLIGRNFYQTFKPYTREELHAKGVILFDEVQELLDSGKKPEEIFNSYDDFYEGFAVVELNDKYNFINVEGKLLSSQWFDCCDDFSKGFARVELNHKWNFINVKGKLLSNQWFDWCDDFRKGLAWVELNNKWNFINVEGKLLSSQWFDYCGYFRERFAKVKLNGKYNFINVEGKLLSSQWFDCCDDFSKGFARVELNHKWNFINVEGKLLSSQWFDYCGYFSEGFARVQLNNKWFKIDREGRLYNENGRPLFESKKNRKTIYITEEQKKKLKKAITAQDQVGGKVNAGVMDSVVGMCENIEDDKYELGNEKGDISPYYHVNESNEEIITLYHGVKKENLEYNLEHGCFVPRVCAEGGPKAVWLSEKQYGYPFIFKFEIPKSLVEQISNVDYIYENEISFDEFNCELVRTSIYTYTDSNIVVEVNLLSDKLSKIHFRYFPDLGMKLWKEFKDYPLILEKYINPYIEKYQQLSEGIEPNRMVDINQVINSPEFKAWFGNSKVVDENGLPLIVHHGSPKFIGDKFDKEKIGKSINGGEENVFCTTQDMSWAKRFSYPASQGSNMFTVKLDYSKPGDILSGFLKIEHPLDLFNLSEQDIDNMFKMHIKYDEFGQAFAKKNEKEKYYEKFVNEIKELVNIPNHQLIKHYIHRNLGNALKEFNYDGYIADMGEKDGAKEYCFLEPNQFKSIYSLAFNPNSDSIYEGKKKIIKNDKGEIVPEKCDKCGGEVVLQIHGEPVYLCKDCGKYFGTMPFHLNESMDDVLNVSDDDFYSCYSLLSEFDYDKEHGIKQKQWNLIPAQQYHNLLKRYMESPVMARIPYDTVSNWFLNIIVPNAFDLSNITDLAGHSSYFPSDDVSDYFSKEIKDYDDGSEFLNDIGFYDWCKLPDGSDAWSDYGLKPLFSIIQEYTPNMEAGDLLILINRCLDVVHQRGDLSSAFIEGGKYSCDYISNNVNENKLNENIEIEDKWNGNGQKLQPFAKVKYVPEILYHTSYHRNHESILKNGIYASVGYEYSNWWNYDGPNGEIPDDDELEPLVFLTRDPLTWVNNFYIDNMDIYEIDTTQLDNNRFYYDPDDSLSDKGSFCYAGNIPPSAIKLYDRVYHGKSIKENVENEITPDEVDLSSFNIKKKLNPKFWIDGHLDSRIRLKLLDISDDFIEYLGIDPDIVKDVIITGSLANFNWNEEFSDIDLHVLLDYSDVDENTEFVKQYFMSQKNSWNNEHQDLKIFGFPIEVYVQDVNEKHDSSGVYSLDRDKWLREPDRDVLASSKVNKEFIRNKVSDYVNKIDKLLYIYKKAKNDEYKLRKLSEKVERLWNEIKDGRKYGFEKSGGKEINNLNICFKSLRRLGYLDKLYDLKTKTYDKLMSL